MSDIVQLLKKNMTEIQERLADSQDLTEEDLRQLFIISILKEGQSSE